MSRFGTGSTWTPASLTTRDIIDVAGAVASGKVYSDVGGTTSVTTDGANVRSIRGTSLLWTITANATLNSLGNGKWGVTCPFGHVFACTFSSLAPPFTMSIGTQCNLRSAPGLGSDGLLMDGDTDYFASLAVGSDTVADLGSATLTQDPTFTNFIVVNPTGQTDTMSSVIIIGQFLGNASSRLDVVIQGFDGSATGNAGNQSITGATAGGEPSAAFMPATPKPLTAWTVIAQSLSASELANLKTWHASKNP